MPRELATLPSARAMLDEALRFEESTPRAPVPTSRWTRKGLDNPFEEVSQEVEEDEKLVSDMPWDPLDLGQALIDSDTLPGESRDDELAILSHIADKDKQKKESTLRDLPSDLNPHDLSETGWGLILPAGALGDALLDALKPLCDHRREQAGSRFNDELARYVAGTAASTFEWDALDLAPGVVDPDKVPYYLLIVGGPEDVPFSVQYALAVNHAIGRIAFDDLADYGRWAQAVVDAERAGVSRAHRTAMLAVEDGSPAMERVRSHLVDPLAERLEHYMKSWPASAQWPVDVRRGQEADKAGFLAALAGHDAPALALLAAHGLPLSRGNPHQRTFQGAICCQRTGQEKHKVDRLVFGGDVDALAKDQDHRPLHGLIAFLFTCYGAGTPREDDFPQFIGKELNTDAITPPELLAESPFLAALPQAMLRQGALAVVGHVDRGWTLSFSWTLAGRTTDGVRSLEDSLKQLVRGHRLGHALRSLNRRHNAIASYMSELLNQRRRGKSTDAKKLAVQWTAHHDARNFILLGDPAVYLGGQRPTGPGYCCDQWATTTAAAPIMRTFEPADDALVLPADLQRFVQAEAKRRGHDPQAWLTALIRNHVASQKVMRG